MQTYDTSFLGLLRKTQQFAIPIYQRTYSWTKQQCDQLWGDILRTGEDDRISAHFTGSIVYVKDDPYHTSEKSPPHFVIDGQQRLATVMLLLEALARNLGDSEPVDGFSAKKVRSYYLRNELEERERSFKLLLTQADKQRFLAIMQQEPLLDPSLYLIEASFAFFEGKIGALKTPELVALCRGLAKLMVVEISLEHKKDNPQLIFESMNSTGLHLSQADLIRNFILMGLDPEDQERLYKERWQPMEAGFGQVAYGKHFDSFMWYYLTFRVRSIMKRRDVYEVFKRYSRTSEVEKAGVDALVADICTYAGHYCAMALDQEKANELKLAFQDLRQLKVDVAFPFLLELYGDYALQQLSRTDFEQAVRLVEAYVFRRAVCDVPTNALRWIFAEFGQKLEKGHYVESIQKGLLDESPHYKRFPDDEEFKRNLLEKDLYNFNRRSYYLGRMENHGRKERVPVEEYTVEHIMPQNLPKSWHKQLGRDPEAVHKKWLHTLGNLTLTGYNSEYSNRPFSEKRDMLGGFKESPLRLNEGLGDLDTWDEDSIRRRGEELAALAVQVWARPVLAPDKLRKLPTKPKPRATYTIDDHPHLVPGSPTRRVFDLFRKAVLELDTGITEEFLKEYVAYKALTNFVDVVPQKKRLLLTLNLQFHELHDPKKLARDVTDLGVWGNGDAQIGLDSEEGLFYVMGLVRQALEKQAGDEAADD